MIEREKKQREGRKIGQKARKKPEDEKKRERNKEMIEKEKVTKR